MATLRISDTGLGTMHGIPEVEMTGLRFSSLVMLPDYEGAIGATRPFESLLLAPIGVEGGLYI